eukprot:4538419-Heterocapsa_arctica.AAC.1
MKHLEVGQLWLQDQLCDGKLIVAKLKSDLNPADLMTKWFVAARHQWLSAAIGAGPNENGDDA